MGHVVNGTYDQDGWRARTNVKDPSGVNAAFDSGDAAKDADWTQAVDELFRVRFIIKQTTSTADANLQKQFRLEYNINGTGWNPVTNSSAVFAKDANFTNHDDTTQLIGSGTFVTGDGIDEIDYKNIPCLKKYIMDNGRIVPSRITGTRAKFQRQLALAIKRARYLALLPYCDLH